IYSASWTKSRSRTVAWFVDFTVKYPLGRLARLQLEQFLRILDHLRIPLATLLYEHGRFLVRATESETQDRAADNRNVVGFLVLKLQDAIGDFPAVPFAQVFDGQVRDVV